MGCTNAKDQPNKVLDEQNKDVEHNNKMANAIQLKVDHVEKNPRHQNYLEDKNQVKLPINSNPFEMKDYSIRNALNPRIVYKVPKVNYPKLDINLLFPKLNKK